jgi:hypothetical protein
MGSKKGFAYAFFASLRSYSYSANFMKPDSVAVINEKFALKDDATVGGSLRYDHKENMYASVGYEKLLGKDYVFNAEVVSPYVTLKHKRMSYAPSAVQRRFFGNHFRWTTDFDNTLFSTTSAATKFSAKNEMFIFEPTVSYSDYENYVYFDTLAHIKQSSEKVNLLQAGLDFTFKKEAIVVKMKTYYSQSTGADLIRVPQIFSNLTVMLDKKAYKNALHYQIGADIHFRSKYFADDYNPFLMQFFLQNKEKTSGFPVTDIFFNFKVKRFIAFLKVNNVAQDLFGPGYFVTPYYMGQPRSLEIGMNWLFYD